MSTDFIPAPTADATAGDRAAETLVAETKRLVDDAVAVERAAAGTGQSKMFDPVSPEEMAEAQERLGANAGNLSVLREARAARGGRPKGARNRRSDDFARYILSFGQHPAITMMEIQTTPPEVLVERSRQMDPVKRRMSYGDAQALRVRCAEGLLPFIESKKPVALDVTAKGDFSLLIPGFNISESDAQQLSDGTFVLAGEYIDAATADDGRARNG